MNFPWQRPLVCMDFKTFCPKINLAFNSIFLNVLEVPSYKPNQEPGNCCLESISFKVSSNTWESAVLLYTNPELLTAATNDKKQRSCVLTFPVAKPQHYLQSLQVWPDFFFPMKTAEEAFFFFTSVFSKKNTKNLPLRTCNPKLTAPGEKYRSLYLHAPVQEATEDMTPLCRSI